MWPSNKRVDVETAEWVEIKELKTSRGQRN